MSIEIEHEQLGLTDHTHEATGSGATGGGSTLQPAILKLQTAGDLTIATGAITVTGTNHRVDTEAAAAVDDLDTVNGMADNQFVFLRLANDAHEVNLTSAGNMYTLGGNSVRLRADNYALLYKDPAVPKILLMGTFVANFLADSTGATELLTSATQLTFKPGSTTVAEWLATEGSLYGFNILFAAADDPTAGAGLALDAPGIYVRDNAGSTELWIKTGAGDTAWTQLGTGVGAHTLASHSTRVIDNLTDVDTVTTAPTLSDVLKWNGSNWVPAAYNYSFTFSLDSFTATSFTGTSLIGSGNWKAIGAVQFDAAYTNMPVGTTATVALTGSASDWSGLALAGATGPTTNATAITYPTTRTGTLTVTVTPSNSPTPATRTDTQSFSNTMRYGTNANGIGAQTEANVEALSEVAGPDESRSQTISNIPAGTAGHKLTIAHANALSSAAQIQRDSGFGYVTASFAASATQLAPDVQTSGLTTVTNSAGFVEAFKAYTARLADLTNGTNDFKLLTSSTAQNYFYWGELNKASGYTEADIEGNYASAPGKVASNTLGRSCVVNCAAGEYAYIAYPARLGALTSIVIGGFESIGDFTVDNTALAVTNDAGYQENYRVYVSNNPSFADPTTMVIS